MAKNTMLHDVTQALAKLCTKHNFSHTLKVDTKSRVSITIELNAVDKQNKDRFRDLAALKGVDESLFGKQVTIKDSVYKVVGINPSAQKKPIILEAVSGRAAKETLMMWRG